MSKWLCLANSWTEIYQHNQQLFFSFALSLLPSLSSFSNIFLVFLFFLLLLPHGLLSSLIANQNISFIFLIHCCWCFRMKKENLQRRDLFTRTELLIESSCVCTLIHAIDCDEFQFFSALLCKFLYLFFSLLSRWSRDE